MFLAFGFRAGPTKDKQNERANIILLLNFVKYTRLSPKGVPKQNRKSKSKKFLMKTTKAPIGPWPKHVSLRFVGSKKINHLRPIAEIKKVDG